MFFTGDHHFGHNNIIKYSNRLFASSEEMDDKMVEEWNSVAGEEDTVFHLGDFSLSSNLNYVQSLFGRLNGVVYFLPIWWHHVIEWERIRDENNFAYGGGI